MAPVAMAANGELVRGHGIQHGGRKLDENLEAALEDFILHTFQRIPAAASDEGDAPVRGRGRALSPGSKGGSKGGSKDSCKSCEDVVEKFNKKANKLLEEAVELFIDVIELAESIEMYNNQPCLEGLEGVNELVLNAGGGAIIGCAIGIFEEEFFGTTKASKASEDECDIIVCAEPIE